MPNILSSKTKATATLDLFFRKIHHQLPKKKRNYHGSSSDFFISRTSFQIAVTKVRHVVGNNSDFKQKNVLAINCFLF